MSIYDYTTASAVNKVVFHHAKSHPPVALLTAGEGATDTQILSMHQALEKQGWQLTAVYVEGKSALQVSGFKRESELNDFLSSNHFTQGPPVITAQPGDNPVSTLSERIQRISLKLTGLLNLTGNVALATEGFKSSDPYRVAGGSLMMLGAANLAYFGNAKSDQYTHEITENLEKFVREQPDGLPQNSIPSNNTKNAQNFLYHYPVQVTLGIDSLGATANLTSGIKNFHSKGWAGIGFGLISLGLKLSALLIPEKSKGEKLQGTSQEKNFIGKAIDWVKEKPLFIYGFGSLVSDACLGIDTFKQYKKDPGKKGYIFTAIATTCYTLADILVGISSKDHVNSEGKFDADQQRVIEVTAAQYLVNQPETSRTSMAQKMGNFLSTRKELRGNTDSISRSIIEQAEHLRNNPWASRATKNTFMTSER